MSDDEPLVACKRCQLAQRVLKQQTQIITDLERRALLAEKRVKELEEWAAIRDFGPETRHEGGR